jgi:beta-phosphoglucomutase-like phosphatase (HAD superfamily)
MNKTEIGEILTKKKAVFFDMDGVLYDSMGYHAEAWSNAFLHFGIDFPQAMVYQNEGRTAQSTINQVYQQNEERDATESEIDLIYSKKTELIDVFPDAVPFKGAHELMMFLKNQEIDIWVVTGSSQDKFLDALLCDFEGLISANQIVSGKDVKHGKPHPEPYLTALMKSGLNSDEVVVIENAPLGIQSSKAAGIFTIGINTGILEDSVLWEAGADLVFKDWTEFKSGI